MSQGQKVVAETAQIQKILLQIQEVKVGMLAATLQISKMQNELKQSIGAIEDKSSIPAL